jgi:hypothetical protein
MKPMLTAAAALVLAVPVARAQERAADAPVVPTVGNVTIVSGSLHVGMGKSMDKSGGTTLATGGFASIPADAPKAVTR